MSGGMPPCDLDAEAAVLSASLLSPEAFDEARSVLTGPEAFFAEANRLLWRATCGVWDDGGAPDAVTVASWLRHQGKLEAAGGMPYIAQIVDATPAVAHVSEHAREVRDLSQVRSLLDALRAHLAVAQTQLGKPRAWLEQAEAIVFRAAEAPCDQAVGELASEIASRVFRDAGRVHRGELRPGSTTGLPELDEHTGGLGAGKLWYLAGRPGMGKTALGWGFAEAVARDGELALDFSLEMKREEVVQRALARGASLSSRKIANGALEDDEWARVAAAVRALDGLPLIVDDDEDLTPGKLRSRIRRYLTTARRRWPDIRLGVVVVDYLQLMDDDEKHSTENARLETVSRKLKKIAGAFSTCVVCMSQLNRKVEEGGRTDKRPSLEHLRGSGAIEQDADVVLFVYRDDYYRPRGEKPDKLAELIVAKGRSSGDGVIWARFEAPWTSFYPHESDESQQTIDYGADDAAE